MQNRGENSDLVSLQEARDEIKKYLETGNKIDTTFMISNMLGVVKTIDPKELPGRYSYQVRRSLGNHDEIEEITILSSDVSTFQALFGDQAVET